MEKNNLIGKKLYGLVDRSYEGEISEEGVEGRVRYLGIIKDFEDEWITLRDSPTRVLYGDFTEGYLFLNFRDVLK